MSVLARCLFRAVLSEYVEGAGVVRREHADPGQVAGVRFGARRHREHPAALAGAVPGCPACAAASRPPGRSGATGSEVRAGLNALMAMGLVEIVRGRNGGVRIAQPKPDLLQQTLHDG